MARLLLSFFFATAFFNGGRVVRRTQHPFPIPLRFAQMSSSPFLPGLNATTWKAHVRQRFSVSLALILCFPPCSIKRPRVPIQSNRGRIISGKTGRRSRGRGGGGELPIAAGSVMGAFHIGAIMRALSTIRRRKIFWDSLGCIFSCDSLNGITAWYLLVSSVLILDGLVTAINRY